MLLLILTDIRVTYYILLRLTEKQYNNIYIVSVSGELDYQEKTVGVNAHIML